MVVVDEQQGIQLRNAEADERFWSTIRDVNQTYIDGFKRLIANAQSVIAKAEIAVADADASVEVARKRVERIKRGESVDGGLGEPLDWEDLVRTTGMTEKEIRHCQDISRLNEEELKHVASEAVKAGKRAERSIARALARRKLLDDEG
jgi:hypothetical protein